MTPNHPQARLPDHLIILLELVEKQASDVSCNHSGAAYQNSRGRAPVGFSHHHNRAFPEGWSPHLGVSSATISVCWKSTEAGSDRLGWFLWLPQPYLGNLPLAITSGLSSPIPGQIRSDRWHHWQNQCITSSGTSQPFSVLHSMRPSLRPASPAGRNRSRKGEAGEQ